MKKKVNYNISESTIKDFNELAKKKAINKSQLIENLIEKWVKENK
jgi:hypothetical protein